MIDELISSNNSPRPIPTCEAFTLQSAARPVVPGSRMFGEQVYLWKYLTIEDVFQRLPYFKERMYYNLQRLDAPLGYMSAKDYEAQEKSKPQADILTRLSKHRGALRLLL